MEKFFQAGAIGIYFYIGFCIVGIVLIVCWIIVMYKILLRRNTRHEGSNLMDHHNEEWHTATDVPCPGSLIVCEDGNGHPFFGYAVASNGKPALWHLPYYISDFRKPPATIAPQMLQLTPILLFKRWQYLKRRIFTTETLSTYAEQYKEDR